MSESETIKLGSFDALYWKLSLFSWDTANYNVVDFLGDWDERNPPIRCIELLKRTNSVESHAAAKSKFILPCQTFDLFRNARTAFNETISKTLFAAKGFDTEFTAAVEGFAPTAFEDFDRNTKLVALARQMRENRDLVQKSLADLEIVLQNLKKGNDFCALSCVSQSEKNTRDFGTALKEELSRTLRTSGKYEDEPNERFKYYTDTEWHSNVNATHLDGLYLARKPTCSCALVTDYGAWLSAAWNKHTPNVDGRGPDTKFCVFKNKNVIDYSQASFSDLIGLFSIGLSGKDPVTHQAKLKPGQYVDPIFPKEANGKYSSHQVRIGQLTLALFNELAAQKVIKDQWKVLEKAKAYLQDVRKTQDACIKPLEDLIAHLKPFVALVTEIDGFVSEIPRLMLFTGSSFVIRQMKHEALEKLGTLSKIWALLNTDQTKQETVQAWTPRNCTIEFIHNYAVTTVIEKAVPYNPVWPRPQTKDDYTYRDCHFNIITRSQSSTGFGMDIGEAMDRDWTECHGLTVCWMDIPRKGVGEYAQAGWLKVQDATAEKFRQTMNVRLPLPEWLPDADARVICWINGMQLSKAGDYNVSLASKDQFSVDVKAGGTTDMSMLMLNYLFYRDTPNMPIFTKVFKTTKVPPLHTERISFGSKFKKTPRLFYALTGLDVDSKIAVRFDSKVSELSKDGAVIEVWSWFDSMNWDLEFVVFACEGIDVGTL